MERREGGQERQEESIFNYYSLENEALFLRRIKDLPLAERRFYVRENVLTFLAEFVGRVPYKKISYLLKEDGFDYAGLRVMEIYRETAEMAGRGSREWFEARGVERVQEAFLSSEGFSINCATLISPPKIADYGFVFHFVKGGHEEGSEGQRVEEYILRYPEERGRLAQSQRILEGLTPQAGTFPSQRTKDFLENPILAYTPEPDFDLKTLLALLGIDEEAVAEAQYFERLVSEKLSSWIERYFQGVLHLSELEVGGVEFLRLGEELKVLFTAIYNKAQEIKEELEKKRYTQQAAASEVNPLFEASLDDGGEESLIFYYASLKAPTVEGGGSCPVTNFSFHTDDFFSSFKIYTNLSLGRSIENLFALEENSQEAFECPRCHFRTYERVGNRCPSCGLTKEQFIKEAKEKGISVCA